MVILLHSELLINILGTLKTLVNEEDDAPMMFTITTKARFLNLVLSSYQDYEKYIDEEPEHIRELIDELIIDLYTRYGIGIPKEIKLMDDYTLVVYL